MHLFHLDNLWGLAERKLLPRKQEPAAAAASGPSTAIANGPPPRRGPRSRREQRRQPEAPPTAIQKLKNWWAEVLRSAEKR